MSNNPGENKPEEKRNNIDSLRRAWAKSDIQRLAAKSKKKLEKLVDEEGFEKKLEHQARSKAAQRALFRSQKHGSSEISSEHIGAEAVYEAKAAVGTTKARSRRRQGFIGRTISLIKGLSAVKRSLKGRDYVTAEQKKKLQKEVLWDAWTPECQAMRDLADNTWDFISDFGSDAWDIVLFIADLVIKLGFFLATLGYFLYDVLWDVRLFLEEHKHKLFLWFSSLISAAAIIAITVSSVSAFEYSYYGKKRGVARSKEEVYRTITVLGDKLSEASGANVNLDVQRDMEFKRIYGFHLAVDTPDTILNTITYMKDFQADASAICIDGRTAVVLENADTANAIIDQYRKDFAGERTGVEYSLIKFMESVTVEPVQVLLGDIWNESDALHYLETGYTRELAEGEDAVPQINIYSVETATYEEDIPFEIEYIENTSLYADETKVFTEGITGKQMIVAKIVRYNGIEQEREILSSARTSNPINAVYYKGTKPLPESRGTGTFIFPLQDAYFWSAGFGEYYGVPGVNPVHSGDDFACPIGTHIYASDGGVVVYAGWDTSGYGLHVIIDHGGLYKSVYGHCSELFVQTGELVYQGKHIANVGSTGVSTGPHLHFEVRYKDVAIDPMSVLNR